MGGRLDVSVGRQSIHQCYRVLLSSIMRRKTVFCLLLTSAISFTKVSISSLDELLAIP